MIFNVSIVFSSSLHSFSFLHLTDNTLLGITRTTRSLFSLKQVNVLFFPFLFFLQNQVSGYTAYTLLLAMNLYYNYRKLARNVEPAEGDSGKTGKRKQKNSGPGMLGLYVKKKERKKCDRDQKQAHPLLADWLLVLASKQ